MTPHNDSPTQSDHRPWQAAYAHAGIQPDLPALAYQSLGQLAHESCQRYASQKALIRAHAPQAKDFTNQRTRRGGVVDEVERGRNRNKSRIRARVEHVFAVVKRLWGFTKVRYRGIEKNANRAFVALALANLYLSRARLMG